MGENKIGLFNRNSHMYEGRSKSFAIPYDAPITQAQFLRYYST